MAISRKLLIIISVAALLIINGIIIAVLYFSGLIFQPSAEELEAVRLAEEEAQRVAEETARYAHLEPLPEFKSKASYVASMSEAVDICEKILQEKEPGRKSWAVNYIESRHLPDKELYMVFLDYETIVPLGEEPKIMKVTCEVIESTKTVENWKAMKAE